MGCICKCKNKPKKPKIKEQDTSKHNQDIPHNHNINCDNSKYKLINPNLNTVVNNYIIQLQDQHNEHSPITKSPQNKLIQNYINPKSNSSALKNIVTNANTITNNFSLPKDNSLQHKQTLAPVSLNINYKTFIGRRTYSELLKEYIILEHLGAGAYGVVQKVKHKSTGQIRAMKTIRKNSVCESKSLREIENLMLLDHPKILKLYEFFYDNKHIYIITEYCEGGELFDKIKERNGFFTERDAATILKSVLQAVAYCHSMKLVHRDLKPENIILEGNSLDNIKLIDFGTANIISPNQKFKERLGTAYYIAPEVLKKNYDEKCDLWSIGVIMYILLTGEPPFNGENDEEILRNVKTGIVNFSSPIFEEVTKDAKDLLKKLLHITPSKRISAVCALEHPWIKNLAPNMMMKPEIAKKVFENLQSFQANQKLQEATVAFIVNQLISREEIKGLRELFVELDTNCDGVLSREELEIGLTLYYGKDNAKKQTELIFMNVDADKNGFISYDEFVRASIDKVKLLSEEKLRAAYGLFDKNGDGGIEAKEIKEVLGRDLADNTDGIWKEIVNEVDKNGDGIISYEEFKEMMENICKR